VIDHFFTVPLDHDEPGGPSIELYAREVRGSGKDLPWLVFLNGGPGFASPRPVGRPGWLDRALRDYRVLLLDQRGTGRSTPVSRAGLAKLGDAAAQAEYLTHFRADSIVRDAEAIRRALIGDAPWSLLGQSFGGFCATAYLSTAPEGLREAFVTGGLPGLTATADDVYRRLYPRVLAKNLAHYERFPGDVEQSVRVAGLLRERDARLPGGRRLTVEAFQALGNLLGSSTGSEVLHFLLEAPFDGTELSDAFLVGVERELTWAAGNPLYYVLHEPCYAQGEGATSWSAQRVRAEFGEFDDDERVLFTGEMIYPWMFDNDPLLQPLREAAHLLAERPSWPRLYDVDRLRGNMVPVAAAVYYEDMYVDFDLSMETARTVGGVRPWVTNQYQHDGLRVSNGVVLDRLIELARD